MNGSVLSATVGDDHVNPSLTSTEMQASCVQTEQAPDRAIIAGRFPRAGLRAAVSEPSNIVYT